MEHILELLETIVHFAAKLGIIFTELTGIVVLILTAIKSIHAYVKHDDNIKIDLAQGIALALEFKMGGEVLRTVVVREWQELGILGAIILLRGVLTFLIHWEIRNEKHELAQENQGK